MMISFVVLLGVGEPCARPHTKNSYNEIYVNLVNIIAGIALVITLATAAAAAPSNTQTIDPKTAGLLEFIGTLEAPKGYNSYAPSSRGSC